jgi:hypothetical protein
MSQPRDNWLTNVTVLLGEVQVLTLLSGKAGRGLSGSPEHQLIVLYHTHGTERTGVIMVGLQGGV